MSSDYDVVIGLEIHAQLLTQSKCFTQGSTDFNLGHNECVTPTCAGMPGTLPALNSVAVERAIKASLALNCDVQNVSIFSRKQYFYPDMPKGYQITQYEKPIALNGSVEFFLGGQKNTVRLERAHMEEDAGKSTHHGEYTLVNLNRAGVPLLEIVSRPEIASPAQAAAFARAVRQCLVYAEVCDGNLEEGSLRCDCNISIKPKGQKELGTKVELKNINSFRFIEKALEYEISRQIQCARNDDPIVQETRLYDSTKNKTFSMRKKEEATDYRYFPEPDLMPLLVSAEQIAQIQSSMPELPLSRFERFVEEYQLSNQEAETLVSEKSFADYYEAIVIQVKDPKLVCNWVTGEFLRLFNDTSSDWSDCPLHVEMFSELLLLIKNNKISGKMGKEVLEEMWKTQKTASTIIKEKGMEQISDPRAIEKMIDNIINENPKQVADYKGGKDKLFGFFVGQVMKLSKGQANPDAVNKLLKEKLKK